MDSAKSFQQVPDLVEEILLLWNTGFHSKPIAVVLEAEVVDVSVSKRSLCLSLAGT